MRMQRRIEVLMSEGEKESNGLMRIASCVANHYCLTSCLKGIRSASVINHNIGTLELIVCFSCVIHIAC